MRYSSATGHKLAFLVFALLASTQLVSGQSGTFSPYSRFGIGLLSADGAPRHFGMGGVSTPTFDANILNFSNPATYAYLNEPVFHLAAQVNSSRISDASGSTTFRGGQVNEIGLGFRKAGSRWGFAIGLRPYSSAGYSMEQESALNDSTDVRYTYEGDGGINRLLVGAARSIKLYADTATGITHTVHIGANFNYFFGSLEQRRYAVYDNVNFYNTRLTSQTSVSDVNLDFGLHYVAPLHLVREKKKVLRGSYLAIGVDYSLAMDMNTEHSELGESFYYFTGIVIPVDTSFQRADVAGSLAIPEKISIGAAYLRTNQGGGSFNLSADYRFQDWTSFGGKYDGVSYSQPLEKLTSISLGVEYIPMSGDQARSFHQKIAYRAGFRQTETYLQLNGTRITEEAVSIGFSIPLTDTRSRFTIGAEAGRSGSTSDGLVQEEFLRIQVGLNLNPFERWFLRRRFD